MEISAKDILEKDGEKSFEKPPHGGYNCLLLRNYTRKGSVIAYYQIDVNTYIIMNATNTQSKKDFFKCYLVSEINNRLHGFEIDSLVMLKKPLKIMNQDKFSRWKRISILKTI